MVPLEKVMISFAIFVIRYLKLMILVLMMMKIMDISTISVQYSLYKHLGWSNFDKLRWTCVCGVMME